MTALVVIGWILTAACLAILVYWAAVGGRVLVLMRDRPSIRAGLSLPAPAGGWPHLSVIVPAHNEQRVIGDCCASLRQQRYPSLEIIFVLDRCTDRTADILRPHAAEDSRVKIIENDSCPENWAGKCNAARIGSEQATGQYLLFTDADTQFDPDLCRAAVALAADRQLGLLSLLSSLTYDRLHERVAQPVAAINLVRLYPYRRMGQHRPGARTRPFANGQFMLFQRQVYEELGGHHGVRDDLLEDLAFARQLNDKNGRLATFLADNMLRVSMYESLQDFREGWKRIFIEAVRRRPKRLRQLGWRLLGSGVIGPATMLVTLTMGGLALALGDVPLGSVMIVTAALAVLVQFGVLSWIYVCSGAPAAAALLYPAGAWIVARSMLEGARDLEARRPVKWGGRQYILEPNPHP